MRFIWVLATISLSSAAFAEEPCPGLEQNYSAIAVAECAQANFDKADRSLNKTYGDVVSFLKVSKRDLLPLKAAERAWIGEREARCKFRAEELDVIDKTGDGAILDCMTRWTRAREAVLKDYLE